MHGHPILIVVYKVDARADGLRRAWPGCAFLPLFEHARQSLRVPWERLRPAAVLWTYVPRNWALFQVAMRKLAAAEHWLYQHDEPHIRQQHPHYVRSLPYFRRALGTSRLLAHTLPLVDCRLFRPLRSRRFCDVSLAITILYEGQPQRIPRLDFVREMGKLAAEHGVRFQLYGPPALAALPGYQRMIAHEELPALVRGSAVNVSLHLGEPARNRALGYVNERCMLVLACGGLLLVDSCNSPQLRHGWNCIEMAADLPAVRRQVLQLLADLRTAPGRFRRIRRRGRALALQHDLAGLPARLAEAQHLAGLPARLAEAQHLAGLLQM